MEYKPIPAREVQVDLRVVNSRFIATAGPAFSVEEAKTFISRMRTEYADATHNVPAFLIGHPPAVIAHCSDDGEPSGTAGRPMLSVLTGSGLGDVVVVVTRYFGGTKLGTGGLVRAYSDAVREVLAVLPRAVKVPTHTVMLACSYSLYERIKLAILGENGKLLDESFGVDVTLTVQFTFDDLTRFQSVLCELSSGTIVAEIVETNEATIMPFPRGEVATG